MHADATDLSAFASRGGKTILFHGVSNSVRSVHYTPLWYKAVPRKEKGLGIKARDLSAIKGAHKHKVNDRG